MRRLWERVSKGHPPSIANPSRSDPRYAMVDRNAVTRDSQENSRPSIDGLRPLRGARVASAARERPRQSASAGATLTEPVIPPQEPVELDATPPAAPVFELSGDPSRPAAPLAPPDEAAWLRPPLISGVMYESPDTMGEEIQALQKLEAELAAEMQVVSTSCPQPAPLAPQRPASPAANLQPSAYPYPPGPPPAYPPPPVPIRLIVTPPTPELKPAEPVTAKRYANVAGLPGLAPRTMPLIPPRPNRARSKPKTAEGRMSVSPTAAAGRATEATDEGLPEVDTRKKPPPVRAKSQQVRNYAERRRNRVDERAAPDAGTTPLQPIEEFAASVGGHASRLPASTAQQPGHHRRAVSEPTFPEPRVGDPAEDEPIWIQQYKLRMANLYGPHGGMPVRDPAPPQSALFLEPFAVPQTPVQGFLEMPRLDAFCGPEGVEHLQIDAMRQRAPTPRPQPQTWRSDAPTGNEASHAPWTPPLPVPPKTPLQEN